MTCCASYSKLVRCKIVLVSVFTSVVVIYGGSMVTWIVVQSDNTDVSRQLHMNSLSFACYSCFDSEENNPLVNSACQVIERKCKEDGWTRQEKFPQACKDDAKLRAFVKEKTEEEFKTKSRIFGKKTLKESEQEYVKKAESSFYNANRLIIQWSPIANASPIADTEGWHTIKDFERHESTFTISAGPKKSYHNGAIVVTETGLHLIYARLTFACQKADNEEKRIYMEVVVHETPQHHYILLRDMQLATCSQAEDLLTMYQSGTFRLAQNYKITVRYKSPVNVTLSGDESLYKSSVGLHRIGLA